MVSAGTMPCDTSQDASPLAVPDSLSPPHTRSRRALIPCGSHSRRAARHGGKFSTGLRRVEPVYAVHVACRYAMPVASEGAGIALGLIGLRSRIRSQMPSRLSQRPPAPVNAYDASSVENTMNLWLTSTSGTTGLSFSPVHWVGLL